MENTKKEEGAILLQGMKAGRGGGIVFSFSFIRFSHCGFFILLVLIPGNQACRP